MFCRNPGQTFDGMQELDTGLWAKYARSHLAQYAGPNDVM